MTKPIDQIFKEAVHGAMPGLAPRVSFDGERLSFFSGSFLYEEIYTITMAAKYAMQIHERANREKKRQ